MRVRRPGHTTHSPRHTYALATGHSRQARPPNSIWLIGRNAQTVTGLQTVVCTHTSAQADKDIRPPCGPRRQVVCSPGFGANSRRKCESYGDRPQLWPANLDIM
ncbi:unnamed protein product [Protopolystoma xenopodis]|uniref:Uncharacterized protein n=1 Tax=Protopolystoma xenopodis TaxID=117903 RepID=A0A3S4ZRZ0_9PLAT|nr:unnamed protein product [Protopolystoma xenopodis]